MTHIEKLQEQLKDIQTMLRQTQPHTQERKELDKQYQNTLKKLMNKGFTK